MIICMFKNYHAKIAKVSQRTQRIMVSVNITLRFLRFSLRPLREISFPVQK